MTTAQPSSELEAAVRQYLSRCVPTDDGCLVNPGLQGGGYGEVRYDGKRMNAHRAVLAVSLGRVPARGDVTRHGCDNPPCVNASHLSFGTQSQNIHDAYQRDRVKDHWIKGDDRPNRVLSERAVCELRKRARSGEPLGSIVASTDLNYNAVRMAIRGETWAHITTEPPVMGRKNALPNPRAYRFNRADEAKEAHALAAKGLSLNEIASRLGVTRHTAFTLTQLGGAA